MLASKTIVGHPKFRAHVSLWQPPWPLEGLIVYAYLDGEIVVFALLAGKIALVGVLEAEPHAEVVLAGTVEAKAGLEDEVAIDYESPLDGELYINGEKS